MLQTWFYGLATEDWIYGICSLCKQGRAQNVTQNLRVSSPSIATKLYLSPAFPSGEPTRAQEVGAQVWCLQIQTQPSVSAGVRQNRREARENGGEQIVKACLILFAREITSAS